MPLSHSLLNVPIKLLRYWYEGKRPLISMGVWSHWLGWLLTDFPINSRTMYALFLNDVFHIQLESIKHYSLINFKIKYALSTKIKINYSQDTIKTSGRWMSTISCPIIRVKHLRNGLVHLHSQQKTKAVTRVNSTSTMSTPTTYQSALTMCFYSIRVE